MKHELSIGVGITMIALAGVISFQASENSPKSIQGALNGGISSSSGVCGMSGGQCGGTCGTPGWLCRADSRVSGGCVCKDQATVACGQGNTPYSCGGTCPNASDVCAMGAGSCVCKNACQANGMGLPMCPNPPPQPFYFDVGLGGRCGFDKAATCNTLTGNVCKPIFVYRRCGYGLTCSAGDDSSYMGTCVRSNNGYSSSF